MTQSGEEITIRGEYAEAGTDLRKRTYSYYTTGCCKTEEVQIGGTPQLIPGVHMLFHLKEQHHNLLYINTEPLLQCGYTPDEMVLIHLDPSFLLRYMPLGHPDCLRLMDAAEREMPAAFSVENLNLSPEICMVLQAISASPHRGFCGKLFLETKILELLLLQLSQFEQQENAGGGQLKLDELDKMYQVKEILTSQLDRQFTLRSLAHMVGTNEFNLKRDFKLAFGTTVFGYLNQYKMAAAKRMLTDSDLTVAEVSQKMGYKYATHFSSAFKKFFGLLPNRIKSGKLSWLLFLEDFSVIYENLEVLIGLG
jgi:AraC-like DNA-binding protein